MLVEPGKTALLVVDVLEATVEGRAADPALDAFASACTEVVGACRACGIPVIFLDDAHVPGLDRELELWGEHGIAGSAGARPAACLGPCDRDLVIEKLRGRRPGLLQALLRLGRRVPRRVQGAPRGRHPGVALRERRGKAAAGLTYMCLHGLKMRDGGYTSPNAGTVRFVNRSAA